MKVSLVAALFAGACARASAQTPERFRDLEQSIEERLVAEGVPSIAVAVAQGGRVLWEDAVGFADVEKRVPATLDTLYALGSVTKPITAAAWMLLVERKLLDLDRPANAYLGGVKLRACSGDAAGATLRRLADHTSGLARHDDFAESRRAPLSIDERLRRYGVLVRAPGETREYSNLGYMVLARVIELRAKQPFAEFVRDAVFTPLGMAHSSLAVDAEHCAGAATSYGADKKPRPLAARPDECDGRGGAYASARDLVRFGASHLKQPAGEKETGGSERVLTDASIDTLHRRSSRGGPHSWSTIGWEIEEAAFGATAVLHTGQNDGSTACLVLIPEHRLCVVALSNIVSDFPWRITTEIVGALVPRREAAPKPAESDVDLGVRAYASAEWLGRWEGAIRTHERAVSVAMTFDEAGKVHVRLGDAADAIAGGVRIEDGYLRGSIDGDTGTSDTRGHAYRLRFKLRRHGDALRGSITASTRPSEPLFHLSHCVELERAPAK